MLDERVQDKMITDSGLSLLKIVKLILAQNHDHIKLMSLAAHVLEKHQSPYNIEYRSCKVGMEVLQCFVKRRLCYWVNTRGNESTPQGKLITDVIQTIRCILFQRPHKEMLICMAAFVVETFISQRPFLSGLEYNSWSVVNLNGAQQSLQFANIDELMVRVQVLSSSPDSGISESAAEENSDLSSQEDEGMYPRIDGEEWLSRSAATDVAVEARGRFLLNVLMEVLLAHEKFDNIRLVKLAAKVSGAHRPPYIYDSVPYLVKNAQWWYFKHNVIILLESFKLEAESHTLLGYRYSELLDVFYAIFSHRDGGASNKFKLAWKVLNSGQCNRPLRHDRIHSFKDIQKLVENCLSNHQEGLNSDTFIPSWWTNLVMVDDGDDISEDS